MDAKDEILKAAIELFSRHGFNGVSIRVIADLAGVHFATIRHHFGDKENLYQACISNHGESRLLSAKKFLSSEPKSYEEMRLRLGLSIDDVFQIYNANPFLTKLLLQEVESTSHKSDIVLRKTMIMMAETFTFFFKHCQEKDFINKDSDPHFLTQSLMGVIHHFIRTESIRERLLSSKTLRDKETREKLVDQIVTLFIGNL